MPQPPAKRRRKGVNTKNGIVKKMRRRLAKRVYPLPASHFRCRFVLRENILLNCNIFNCKLLLFLIKEFFVLSVFACVCLSLVERSDTDLYQDKHTSKCQIIIICNNLFIFIKMLIFYFSYIDMKMEKLNQRLLFRIKS